jgi:hypothetical protein
MTPLKLPLLCLLIDHRPHSLDSPSPMICVSRGPLLGRVDPLIVILPSQ